MKLKEIHVEGFGGLGPLSLFFTQGLNIIWGPNEAGKTCLMQFIKAMLFGLSRRDRAYQLYLPLDGKPYGGRAVIEKDNENIVLVARFPGDPKVKGNKPWGDRDKLLYSRVFSLGLAEVSDLTLLSGEEMAQHLYSTTLGPLGKAYSSAVEALEKRREGLFKPKGQKPLINRILKEMRDVEAELSELKALPQQYGNILKEIERLEEERKRTDEAWDALSKEKEEWELLAKAYPVFSHLEKVNRLLENEKLPSHFPPQGLKRLEDITGETDQLTRELEDTKLRLRPIEETLALPFRGDNVLASEKEIQALQGEWSVIKETKTKLPQMEHQLSLLNKSIEEGLVYIGVPKLPPRPTEVVWEKLKEFGRKFERLKEERVSLEKERDFHEKEKKRKEKELEDLKEKTPQKPPLSEEEVISRLGLISQARDHIIAAPSGWEIGAFLFLLAVGVFGTLSSSTLLRLAGGGVALLGTGGVGWACFRRWRWTKEGKQLTKVLKLDKLTLPLLETVEKELKEMEEAYKHFKDWKMKHSDLEKEAALLSREVENLYNAMEGLKQREETLRKDWERWLKEIGLSSIYPPQEVQDILHRVEGLHRDCEERERLLKERDEITENLKGFGDRLSRVLSGLDLRVGSWEEGIVALGKALKEAKEANERRKAQEAEAGRLKERVGLLEKELTQKREELKRLLQEAGVTTIEAFRQVAQAWEEKEKIEKEAEELRLKLTGQLGSNWEEWVPRLANLSPGEASSKLKELREKERELKEKRDELIRNHAELCQKRKELEGEEREQELAQRKEELLEKFREYIHKWTVDSIAIMLFKRTREVYEREHQPRVLQEASRFFSTMTGGRYCRVYLPIGEQALWVERSDGMPLPSSLLSRGTGEQLYLSLSMAIMIEVAQRGIAFPVVLDDILVNFDPTRAARAAEAILSLSNRLQALFFTCHPHIVELFQGMKGVTLHELPPSKDS